MINDIFTPWEWISQYTWQQIDLLRKFPQVKKEKLEETKTKTAEKLSENFTKNESEEEWEYILGLA